MRKTVTIAKTTVKHFVQTMKKYSDEQGFLTSWKDSFKTWWSGSTLQIGFKHVAKQALANTAFAAAMLFIGIPLAAIHPVYKTLVIFKNSVKSARHVHNCDGCRQCKHLQNQNDEEEVGDQ